MLQAILFAVVALLIWYLLVLVMRGLFWCGRKLDATEKWWKASYGKSNDILDAGDMDLFGKLGRFNNAQFMVMPKVEAWRVLAPKHVSKLRLWDHLKMKEEIDFVIFYKQKFTKDGGDKKQIVPVCGVLAPGTGKSSWRKWLTNAFTRAKIPLIDLKPEDLDKENLTDEVINALTKAAPIPDWTPDLIRASMAPKFPPEVLKK